MARRSAGRRGGVFSPSAYVRRKSLNKGLLGDDRFWRVIFFVVFGRRVLRKMMGTEPEIVSVEKLKPGQFVRIAAIDPQTVVGKGRRAK